MTGPRVVDDETPCWDWHNHAACRGLGDLFLSDAPSADDVDTITRTCSGCPVTTTCATAGIDGREYGWWGGRFLVNGREKRPPGAASAA